MRRALLVMLACMPELLVSNAAHSLELVRFRQLVAIRDSHLADMAVERVAWLADERGLFAGGWEQWPFKPKLIGAPAEGEILNVPRTATPRFALSPTRKELAYWSVTGGEWAQLTIAPLAGGQLRYLGEARRINRAMHLAWPTPETIFALMQTGHKSAALAISVANGAARAVAEVEGGDWVALRQWPGWDPIAVWLGDKKRCLRLSATGATQEISSDFDYDRAQPTGVYYSYFDQVGSLWVGGFRDRGPQKVADNVGAACWAADESVLLYTQKDGLWSVLLPSLEKRQLLGTALDRVAARAAAGIWWSADGGALAYWVPSGATGELRRALLACEQVVVRIKYAKNVTPAVGRKIWVARKLQRDKKGRIVEPVWATVKAELAVRKVTRGALETIIEAVSVGSMAGVVQRLAGRAEPETSPPGRGAREFSLAPVPGLVAWIQGTQQVGTILEISVRQSPLTSLR